MEDTDITIIKADLTDPADPIDQIPDPKIREMLRLVSQGTYPDDAAKEAGIGYAKGMRLINTHPEYSEAWQHARDGLADIQMMRLLRLSQQAIDADDARRLKLQIDLHQWWLSRLSSRYADVSKVEHTHKHSIVPVINLDAATSAPRLTE